MDFVDSGIIKSCKFGNVHDNFIFTNSIKRHICDIKNWPWGHDLPTSINDRLISPFRAKFRENNSLSKFPNLQ